MKVLCFIFGHSVSGPHKIIRFGSDDFYMATECKRCWKRFPISPEDAAKKASNDAISLALMNGARAGLGLRPIRWD